MSLLIKREDQWIHLEKSSMVYDLSQFTIKYPRQKEMLLPVVKKMLLCSNYMSWYVHWRMAFLFGFNIILLNISTLTMGIFAKKLPGERNPVLLFFTKIIVLNLIQFPYWIFYYFYFCKFFFKSQGLMESMARYLLSEESLYNKMLSYETNSHFDIIVHKKSCITKHTNAIHDTYITMLQGPVKISHIINIPYDFHIKFYCENLLTGKDKEIVSEVIAFLNRKIMGLRTVLWEKFLFPLCIVIFYYLYIYQKIENHIFALYASALSFLIMLGFIARKLYNKNNRKIIKHLENKNKELLKDRYYIHANDSLISIFVLRDSSEIDQQLIKQYVTRFFK